MKISGCVESHISKTHSTIDMPRETGITFKISQPAQRRSPSFLKLSQATYGKLKQGRHIEFFDQCSLTYMTIRIHHPSATYKEDHSMHVDELEDGERRNNVIHFNA